jgi:hypothetical protein
MLFYWHQEFCDSKEEVYYLKEAAGHLSCTEMVSVEGSSVASRFLGWTNCN